ncbi:MAG: response regulator transcription factor, partial [Chloroflexi bacterium]|nr:response regulator transcription factor [Chloroflexota bacterium]
YITKPFNPRELVARVKAVLRRYQATAGGAKAISVGDVEIDVARHEVRVGGKVVELRPKEFDLLVAMARQPGTVFDRERLLSLVWGYDYYGETRTVDVHIAWLREKLNGAKAQIQTVWGVGYKLVTVEKADEHVS